MNTVPTVVRLSQKLKKTILDSQIKYPFCPLCLGIRDEITNLLEVGSIIKSINIEGDKNIPVALTSQEDWFDTPVEKTMCFGCKRMAISSLDKAIFIDNLPSVVKYNAEQT